MGVGQQRGGPTRLVLPTLEAIDGRRSFDEQWGLWAAQTPRWRWDARRQGSLRGGMVSSDRGFDAIPEWPWSWGEL